MTEHNNHYAYAVANPVCYINPSASGHFLEEFFDAGLSLGMGVLLVLNGWKTAVVAE